MLTVSGCITCCFNVLHLAVSSGFVLKLLHKQLDLMFALMCLFVPNSLFKKDKVSCHVDGKSDHLFQRRVWVHLYHHFHRLVCPMYEQVVLTAQ